MANINVQLKNAGGDILYPQTDGNLVQNKPSINSYQSTIGNKIGNFGNQNEVNTTICFKSISLITDVEDKTKFGHNACHVEPGQTYSNQVSFLTMGRNTEANTWLDQGSSFLGFCSGDGNGGFGFNPFTNKIQVVGGNWAETSNIGTDEIVLKSQLTSTTYCAANSLITEAIFNS